MAASFINNQADTAGFVHADLAALAHGPFTNSTLRNERIRCFLFHSNSRASAWGTVRNL